MASFLSGVSYFNSSSGTTAPITYTRTANSTVLIAVRWEDTDTTVSISATGATFESIAKVKHPSLAMWLELFYAKDVSASSSGIDVAWASAATYRAAQVSSFSGLDATDPYADPYRSGTASSSTACALSESLTVPSAGVTVSACVAFNSVSTWTLPSGYTDVDAANQQQYINTSYKLQSGSGTQAATYQTNASTGLIHIGATFVDVAGGSTAKPAYYFAQL